MGNKKKHPKELIRIVGADMFLLRKDLLGTLTAQLWIGPSPDGPFDNDDQRVARERAMAEMQRGQVGWRISGIEAMTVHADTVHEGWYFVPTNLWVPDTYRFNIHGLKGVQTPSGGKLEPQVRDWEYSWPQIADELIVALPPEQQDFLYLEKNHAGFCFRITVTPDRCIKPAGDGRTWCDRWPLIHAAHVTQHNQKRREQAEKAA